MKHTPGMMIQESKRGEKLWRYRVDGRVFYLLGVCTGFLFGYLLWGPK